MDGFRDLQRAGGHWRSRRRWHSTAGPVHGHVGLVQGARQVGEAVDLRNPADGAQEAALRLIVDGHGFLWVAVL